MEENSLCQWGIWFLIKYVLGQSKKMTKNISNSKLIRYPNQKDAVVGKQDEGKKKNKNYSKIFTLVNISN